MWTILSDSRGVRMGSGIADALASAAEPAVRLAVLEAMSAAADENDARISLRLPDALKGQVEAAARGDGVSVNTWLLRAANAALAPAPTFRHAAGSSGRITGWING